MAAAVKVAVVGTGAMGRNHVRILSSLPGVEMVGAWDARPEVGAAVAAEFGVPALADLDAVVAAADAVVLAVPTVAHAGLGVRLLAAGKHLLVEKPMAATLEEADRLLAAAATSGRLLAVGHVEFHNPAVEALLAIGGGAGIGAGFVEVQRLGSFSPRSLDVDVVLDLMIHDLQILHALDPSPVDEIRATGIRVLSERIDMANVRVALASGTVANLTASRVSAEPARKLRLIGRRRYYSLDYRQQEIKGYRLEEEAGGDRRIVPDDLTVDREEPLKRELEAFVAGCCGEPSRGVDGAAGRRALATALTVVETIAAGPG